MAEVHEGKVESDDRDFSRNIIKFAERKLKPTLVIAPSVNIEPLSLATQSIPNFTKWQIA